MSSQKDLFIFVIDIFQDYISANAINKLVFVLRVKREGFVMTSVESDHVFYFDVIKLLLLGHSNLKYYNLSFKF
jgi:hypothetical protein